MTEEQLKIIRNFEVRIRQVLFSYDKLKEENANLHSQLTEQKKEVNSLREEKIELQTKYDSLKVARMISVSRDDFKATKERLSKLVREVDVCIALLNE
jgi:predicted nuclease with TOPRIM domain